MKDFAHVPGLFNVSISRVPHPNDNYIPEGMFPTALDINLQRLNKAVIEAEIFERVVKKMSLKTLSKFSIEFGENYGQSWNQNEFDILNCVELALKKGFLENLSSMREFIRTTLGKTFSEDELQAVISKLDPMEIKILKENVPFLNDDEYKKLTQHKKNKKKKNSNVLERNFIFS